MGQTSKNEQLRKGRIFFVFTLFALFWVALVLRSAHLQIIPDNKLAGLQKKQYRTSIEIPPRRGNIIDRNGKELAVAIPAYSLYADPQIIADSKKWAIEVGKITKINWRTIYNKIKNKNRRFVWIKKKLSKDQKDKIQALNMRGHGFVEEGQRVYPQEGLLAPVLGFLGSNGRGLEGLERHMDDYLRGEEKTLKVERDARGRPLVLEGKIFTEMPSGSDVQLTIDSDLQFIVEKALSETVSTYNADSAIGIIMDVETSELLSLAYSPTFNNNKPFSYKSDRWRNKIVTDIFEPGSILKTLILAGALREGIVRPNTKIDCEGGKMKIGNRILREADAHHSFDELTVTEVLAKSSNIGTAKVAFRMGPEKTRKILTDFGFGEKTNVGLPGEVSGILKPLPWREHLHSNIAIGQGVAVTPLQVVAAYSAIANGGELRTPLFVKSIRNIETGDYEDFESERVRRVLSSEEASTLRLMLNQVTNEGGTAQAARVPGFTVAGKTGTAQKVSENGGYKGGGYISSFVGMIPAHNPKYVIYVSVDNPRDRYYGSEVAAPLFSRLAGYAIRRSGLAPSYLTKKDLIEKDVKSDEKNQVRTIRSMANDMRNMDKNLVPDFRGLTLREVTQRVRGLPIDIKVQGRGRVVRTYPSANEPLPKSKKVNVIFE